MPSSSVRIAWPESVIRRSPSARPCSIRAIGASISGGFACSSACRLRRKCSTHTTSGYSRCTCRKFHATPKISTSTITELISGFAI